MLHRRAPSNKECAGERASSLPRFSGGSPVQARGDSVEEAFIELGSLRTIGILGC